MMQRIVGNVLAVILVMAFIGILAMTVQGSRFTAAGIEQFVAVIGLIFLVFLFNEWRHPTARSVEVDVDEDDE